MIRMVALGVLLAALAVTAPPSSADAQSRESGGYSSRGLIGEGSTRNLGSRSAVTRPPPFTRPPPLVHPAPLTSPPPLTRPGPVTPPASPLTAPGAGMSGYGKSPIGAAPPGTRATTVKPR
jgi:hypothetical protein